MRQPFLRSAAEHQGPRPLLRAMGLAMAAGAASVFAFAPFGNWWLAIASIGFLFYQVGLVPAPRRAAWIGWAFGLGWSVAGMHWLHVAMHRFGNLPWLLAAVAVVLLGCYMGLFFSAAMAAASWLRQRFAIGIAWFFLAVLPACWSLGEWVRGWLFTGIPWVSSGYVHTTSPLASLAPVFGVYGLGWATALCGGALVMLIQRQRWAGIGALAAVAAAAVGFGQIAWTSPSGNAISVRLNQGNIAQSEKFDAARIDSALLLYRDLLTRQPADLVAAPETAIVLFPQQLPPGYLDSLAAYARDSRSALLFGIPLADSPSRYANSVLGFAPEGGSYRYDKRHLVPFGEFIPPGFRWFTELMRIPLGDFTPGGPVQPAMAVRDQRVLPNICYEDLFGEEIAANLRASAAPATILLNVSNMAWYGESVAIPQHLQLSQMRALETGRPVLRATNNGATAIIDADGQVRQMLPFYQRGTLSGTVQGRQGLTPYVRVGNAGVLLLCLLAVGAAVLIGRQRRA
ncbi:apolipoprotein N-acyltransferase [Massilia sp. TS11]|uniref:apolipoprotein N-acyltransferase n=1 Tax=Massilia sp. TS11 TaxID=2908003 RepID=UPI001EDC4CC7|nr:apolipoprotein N-acyltransferase [Massilia sp. TS11]MCG2583484.1 apolipoprotein N-acyltransferase [Massilia sp. TS11]